MPKRNHPCPACPGLREDRYDLPPTIKSELVNRKNARVVQVERSSALPETKGENEFQFGLLLFVISIIASTHPHATDIFQHFIDN